MHKLRNTKLRHGTNKAIGILYILITSFERCLRSKVIVERILLDQWVENQG